MKRLLIVLPFLLCAVRSGSSAEESEDGELSESSRSLEYSSSEAKTASIADASSENEPVKADLQNDDFLLDPALILARTTRDISKDWSFKLERSGAPRKNVAKRETMDDTRKATDDLIAAQARYPEEPEYWYRRENWRRRNEPRYPLDPYRPPPHRFFPVYPIFPGR